MDYGTFRGIYTLVLLIFILGIFYWAYSRRSKKGFDEAANSIFEDDKPDTVKREKSSSTQELDNE